MNSTCKSLPYFDKNTDNTQHKCYKECHGPFHNANVSYHLHLKSLYVFSERFIKSLYILLKEIHLFFRCQPLKVIISGVQQRLNKHLSLFFIKAAGLKLLNMLMCIKNCVVHVVFLKVKISFLHYSKLISIFVAVIYITGPQRAQGGACHGRFLNPITDICWSCIFPITVGSVPIAGSSKFKDTPNPSVPICLCSRDNVPLMPGIAVGFWEPIRLIEITRTPFCLVSLGGIQPLSGKKQGGFKSIRSENERRSKAYYHIHYYVYPALALLNLLSDFSCMDVASYDLAYMSEVDPAHDSDSLANFMHPEVFLLSSPAAISACAVDCASATARKKPIDSLFWCAGCQGGLYPFTGYVSNHAGGVATSQLLAVRQIAKLHRLGLARKTATDSSKPNGELCSSSYAWRIPKSQYRTQMTYPKANVSSEYACNNIGMSDVMYSSGREYPTKGEDFVYMLWRKRNCCAF